MKKEVVLIIFLILGLSSSSEERLSKRIGYYAGFSLSDKIRGHYGHEEKEKAFESKARLRELKLRGILASKLLINSILGK